MRILTPKELGLFAQERRRRILRISQDEMASRIGASRFWVMDFEAGRPGTEIGLILKALHVLGLYLDAIPTEPEGKPRAGTRRSQGAGHRKESAFDLADVVGSRVGPVGSGTRPSRTRSAVPARSADAQPGKRSRGRKSGRTRSSKTPTRHD